jgi:hypothetical protein
MFREVGDIEQGLITLGETPSVIIMFQPGKGEAMNVNIDACGFDPEGLAGFFTALGEEMSHEPTEMGTTTQSPLG